MRASGGPEADLDVAIAPHLALRAVAYPQSTRHAPLSVVECKSSAKVVQKSGTPIHPLGQIDRMHGPPSPLMALTTHEAAQAG